MRTLYSILFLFISTASFADGRFRKGDTTHVFNKIDTNYIEDYHDMFTLRTIAVTRFNNFTLTDNISGAKLQYGINDNLNMGLGLSFKSIGIEYQQKIYGNSYQFALATGGNSRRFIYDVYFRYTRGFRSRERYLTGDTLLGKPVWDYIYRPDIENYNAGFNLIYVFNNKQFSSAAPYSFTQRQKKSAGSLLLGTYALLYGLSADTVLIPDSLTKSFQPELQFNNASSYTWGVSCGYTYTLVIGKFWYVNIATIPGISFQSFYSTNAYDKSSYQNNSIGLTFQSRFSIGFNNKLNYLGLCYSANNYLIDNDSRSSLNYKFSSIRIYYGHRFDIRKFLKKHM